MHVKSVGNQEHGAFNSRTLRKAEKQPGKTRTPAESPALEPELASNETEGTHERTRGVIRRLEEGHFKGVADVRLRINFYDELASRANSEAAASLPDQVQSLTDSVAGEFASVLGTLGLDEQTSAAANQLLDDFKAAAQQAAGDSVVDGKPDGQALQAKLGEAFNTLLVGLRGMSVPTEPPLERPEQPLATDESAPPVPSDAADQAPASEPASDVATETPPPDGGEVDPLASLSQVFDAAMAALNESLTTSLRLDDPAPPAGHGSAYDKFLAIYNAMRDGSTAPLRDQATANVEVSA